MEKLRISSGVKKIEVNDEGDVILLPVGDDQFLKRFYELVSRAETEARNIKISGDDIVGSMEQVVEFDRAMQRDVDALFGSDTCKKVFGDLLPGCEMFIEFFALLTPFLEEYQKSRADRLNKYGAGRVGSSV